MEDLDPQPLLNKREAGVVGDPSQSAAAIPIATSTSSGTYRLPNSKRPIADLPDILGHGRPLASLRLDSDFQRSAKRRLAFIRFADMPLVWRVNLDILAASVGRNLDYDRDNAAARETDWSLSESALMNAIAAVKAHRHGRGIKAVGLLDRAEDRVHVARAPGDV